MKAVVKTARGVGNVELKDVPEPTPAPDQIKVEVKAAAICGSDIHIYYDEYTNVPPLVLGHEMAGVVVEVGEQVSKYKPGDRVTSQTFAYTCGKCMYCQSGLISLCLQRRSMGVHVDGAFTKYLLQREPHLRRLPDNVDFRAGALSEPLACAVRATCERTRILPGDVVVVSGVGAIGLLVAQMAKLLGASVIVCGTAGDEERLSLATGFGIDHVVNVSQTELTPLVQEKTSGIGADVVIECAGARASMEQCMAAVRKGGRYIQVGLYGRPVEVSLDSLVIKEVDVLPSFTYTHATWDRAMLLLQQGKVKTAPLVSQEYPLTQWEQAFEAVKSRQGCKILLTPVG